MSTYFDPNGVNLTSFGGKRTNKNKVAVGISPTKIDMINDGFDYISYTTSYGNTATQVEIGKDASGNYLNGTIKSFYYFPESLSQSKLTSLSFQKETDPKLPAATSNSLVLKISIPTANTVWNLRNMGFVNATVNWGDNQSQTVFNNTNTYNVSTVTPHTYTTAGVYYVTITMNTTQGVRFDYSAGGVDSTRIISIAHIGSNWSWATTQANDARDFYGCSNLTHIENFVATGYTSLGSPTAANGTFRGCSSLISFPFFDASTLTGVAGTWASCSSLTSFPLLNFQNVTRFGEGNQGAWMYCTGLKSFPLINTSNATGLARAWEGCSGLTSFPPIDTSKCQDFYNTWNGCSSLTSFPALNFSSATGNLGSATGGDGTWRNCSGLTSFPFINISNINGSIAGAWAGCTGLTSFPLLDFSKVTVFGETNQGAWSGCSGLTSFPSINTSAAIRLRRAWNGCSGLTSFPSINTSNVTDIFAAWGACSGLTSFPLLDFSKVTDISGAWNNCSGLTSFPLINTSLVTVAANDSSPYRGAWSGCTGLTSFPALNLSNCLTFGAANGGTWFACTGLTSFPFINFASGTSFNRCWESCTSLATFPANCFDSSPATNFTNAFAGCALTAQSIENIIVSINTSNRSNGTLGLSGGTNAAKSTWTTAANTAYNALVSRGWTITFNA